MHAKRGIGHEPFAAPVTEVAAALLNRRMTLPTPDSAFHWSRETWGDALRCEPLGKVAQHLFTTKQLQLRPFERQGEAWVKAVNAVGGAITDLKRIKQVHGRAICVVRPGASPLHQIPPDADAVVSGTPGHVLAVQVADCVPLLLGDPRTGAVAAIHAGWRGSAARISEACVQTMVEEFGVRPADLIAAVGPSIGECCYEVGPELSDAFRQSGATEDQLSRWFTHPWAGSLRLDLWAVNTDQLIAAGLQHTRIFRSCLCTRTHATVFDSYRAEGSNAGRMAALIRVPRKHEGDEGHEGQEA
jgi:polyphenol oxidase